MEITVTAQDFVNWIGQALRVEDYEETGNGVYIFRIPTRPYVRSSELGTIECHLSTSELEKAIESLTHKEEHEETILYSPTSYEVLVSDHSSSLQMSIIDPLEEISHSEADNGVTYTLSRPSDEYLLFLMYKVSKVSPIRAGWPTGPGPSPRLVREHQERQFGALDIAKLSSRRFLTLRVESSRHRSLSDFSKHANAFLFQVSFNLDRALSPQFYIDELVRAGRIARVRRARGIDELEAPRRHYIPHVVYQYQMGVATDNPPLEYLSYYHVAEHFFKEIFNEDLISRVQNMITRPDFSYRNTRNIQKLIGEITSRIKTRDERVTFNEREALRLVIQKHVDLKELHQEIKSYDPSLVEHYKNNAVPFSQGDAVNLQDSDALRTIDALSKRIYKTRNAIVHSKEGERGRYIPFRHDRILVREVPLIRFIAESIIINTSDIIS